MRLAVYAGASTALAGAVLLRAFTERPNFYSAAVYLGQSNACNLILMNLLLLSFASLVFGLQRVLYGQLRPIEMEQLWDKGWYAVTETALAMTTFRDEVGGWFFILFMSLLAGKVWSWIGDGRVEVLEQQPPANPRLFHARLITSLTVSAIFDALMFRYCARTLQEQPRPGMMVMFAFEFAVLLISATSTLLRYSISAYEIYVEKQQKRIRIEERRAELRAERQQQGADDSTAAEPEVDEEEIDVPGWQEKGRYVLFLDLTTDFIKLILYAAFFTILMFFTGIPIHMFRDLFLTVRSFLKRINDFLKYRNATKDMNARYPDATAQDLERDDTCIICREDMHVWQAPDANARQSRNPPDERQRAKKLPCGHILHVGCLRSWLERQQVCPVCRASVLAPIAGRDEAGNQRDGAAGGGGNQQARAAGEGGVANPPPHDPANREHAPAQLRRPNIRARTFGFGNFRMTFGIGNLGGGRGAAAAPPTAAGTDAVMEQALDRYRRLMDEARAANGGERSHTRTAGDSYQLQLASIERRIVEELNSLSNVQHQLSAVRALQSQLEQLRAVHDNPPPTATASALAAQDAGSAPATASATGFHTPSPYPSAPSADSAWTHAQTERGRSGARFMTAGDPGLPAGLTVPQGWMVMPMHNSDSRQTADAPAIRLSADDLVDQVSGPASSQDQSASAATPTPTSTLPQSNDQDEDSGSATQNYAQARAVSPAYTTAQRTSPSPQPPVLQAEDGQERHTRQSPTLDLPQWGQSNLNSHTTPTAARQSTPEAGTAANGTAGGKGKARAATAEAADADEDDED